MAADRTYRVEFTLAAAVDNFGIVYVSGYPRFDDVERNRALIRVIISKLSELAEAPADHAFYVPGGK